MTADELGRERAFARPFSEDTDSWQYAQTGLTKREWLAGLAMQGDIANESASWNLEDDTRDGAVIRTREQKLAERAVACADALLAELVKEVL
jgi:hypothetical protein